MRLAQSEAAQQQVGVAVPSSIQALRIVPSQQPPAAMPARLATHTRMILPSELQSTPYH